MRVFYFGTYEASGHCLWGPRGWTALAFANYTDDQRPGSNAAFFFDAPLTFDEAVAVARATFPQIVRRFQFKIAETVEPVSH